MNFPKISILLLFFCFPKSTLAQYIQVDDTYSAQQLIENVLIDSPCANVSNFYVSGDTFSPGQQSYGYFTAAGSGFPFNEGIVLSTARAKRSEGPNNNLVDEGSTSWIGDGDLQQALGIGMTYNATSLEFDFTPLTSHISFDYIFASEEYQGSAPCQYSDGFAFLLKPVGSSGPYQNLALIPNSNTPVLVTTVHPAVGNCGAQNEAYFGGFNGFSSPINFNGQTVVMTASATVTPGVTYHIKLVIADEENIRYDSAIFLGGGSFNVGTDLGPDHLFATNNPLCEGETFTLDATEAGANTYSWYKDGVLLTGETNATYTVNSPGTYSVNIGLGTAGCIATGEITIEYTPLPAVTSPVSLVQCDDNGDGITTYNLTAADNIITLGIPLSGGVAYYENLSDAQNAANSIQNPTSYSNSITSTVIARVTNAYGCPNYATVNLQIANNPVSPPAPVNQCDDATMDGKTTFNLDSDVTPQIVASLPPGMVVEYYFSASDAVVQNNPLPLSFINTIPFQQTIYARIINGPDCYGIIPVTLNVRTFNPANFADEVRYLCAGSSINLAVSSSFFGYVWSSGQTNTNTISVTTPGTYSVTVTDSYGCSAIKTFTVIASAEATITNVEIHDFAGNANTVLISYTGVGVYEFSINGGMTYQQSPLFTNVPAGEYLVVVNDINGCGAPDPLTIYVLDYPLYFTPNGDGIHDVWEIENLDNIPDAKVFIFDRYGKFIYSFGGNGIGWNGTLNNAALPSTDYWFLIEMPGGRKVKGHFTLKR